MLGHENCVKKKKNHLEVKVRAGADMLTTKIVLPISIRTGQTKSSRKFRKSCHGFFFSSRPTTSIVIGLGKWNTMEMDIYIMASYSTKFMLSGALQLYKKK